MVEGKKSETINHSNKEESSMTVIEKDVIEINLYELLLVVLEKWYWLVLSAALGVIITVFYSVQIAVPQYEATSKIYVINNKDSVIDVSTLQVANYLTNDYLQVFDNWELHERVLQRLKLDYTYSQLSKIISVRNPTGTRVLVITCRTTEPLLAQSLANTYAEESAEFISEKMDTASPKLFEKALLPSAPVSPNKTRNALMGLLLGIIFAMAGILIHYMTDDYVRTEDDVEKYLNLPTLGTMMLQKDDELFDLVDENDDAEERGKRK